MVSTDEASLVLAWPFRVGGIQRSKEALKVRFPGRRNGLSKGQKCKSLQQRAGVGDEVTAMHAQRKVLPPFLRRKTGNLYQVSASI